MVTGKSARRQVKLAREARTAQAEQEAALEQERARIATIEAGQRANQRTGGGGMLAFVDKRTLG